MLVEVLMADDSDDDDGLAEKSRGIIYVRAAVHATVVGVLLAPKHLQLDIRQGQLFSPISKTFLEC